jgi:hypothetical protein
MPVCTRLANQTPNHVLASSKRTLPVSRIVLLADEGFALLSSFKSSPATERSSEETVQLNRSAFCKPTSLSSLQIKRKNAVGSAPTISARTRAQRSRMASLYGVERKAKLRANSMEDANAYLTDSDLVAHQGWYQNK